MNLDNHIEGINDPNAPFNQPESEEFKFECIDDALFANDTDRAYELLSEVRTKVNYLREYARSNENVYLLKRLNEIYNSL